MAVPREDPPTEDGSQLPWRVAGAYVLAAAVWMLGSDRILSSVVQAPGTYFRLDMLKECVFIALTGVMLYLLVERGTRRLREAERSARASEERYRLLVRTAPDMIFLFGPDGRFLDVNLSALRQSGYGEDEILGQPFDGFIHPDDLPYGKEQFRLALEGTPTRYEVRYLRRDGEPRWISCTNTPVREGDGVTGVLAIVRDVTEPRERERAVQAWKNRYEVAVRTGGIVVYEWDRATDELLWGESLEAVLGYTPGEMGATLDHWAALLHPDDREAALAEVRRIREQEGEFELSYRFLHRDGSYRSIHERGGYPAAGDAPSRVLGVITDVTQRLRDEERLRRAETLAALGQLVSGVAHELNNPLSAILHFTEDLLEDPRPPSDAEALAVIRQQAQRSRTIVRDLLSFARGREERRELVAVDDLMERVVRATRPQVEGGGATLWVDVIPEEVYLEADRTGLEQVVTNLVVNAAQATGDGGTVRLRVSADAGECRIVVEDDGPGIPPGVLHRIFEPFFTTKPVGRGTGLGLSVSRGIVERHGGSIRAENRPEGGASFEVRLPTTPAPTSGAEPATPAPATPAPVPPAAEAGAAATRSRVLVVDDEAAIRNALRRFFTRRGWEVDEAADGTEALRLLLDSERGATFAAVICDLRMPGVSGTELYERLRAERPKLLRRLIFSTGDVTAPGAASLSEAGCPVIEKPFELAALGELVERVRAG